MCGRLGEDTTATGTGDAGAGGHRVWAPAACDDNDGIEVLSAQRKMLQERADDGVDQ